MHDRLIVGRDGSESSVMALERAAGEAVRRGASIRVVSSYARAAKRSFGVSTKDETRHELQRHVDTCRTQIGAALADVQQRHTGLGVDARIVDQSAAEALVEESGGADLVVGCSDPSHMPSPSTPPARSQSSAEPLQLLQRTPNPACAIC